ncbi:odorant receptor 67d isoform X2 [Bactrocera dorsalis]|uniref:Odorant receptor n=1 Tax=Bactrocera dorsalis TaxID=27457 RepID=A0ABM3JZ72_BACDO|nr:odorant receptor 67d isoform X2 [Bactrocera dorsalis]
MTTTKVRPTESFGKIIKFFHLISSLVGADVADENYRVNIITITLIICIVAYFIFTGTTVASVFSENWTYLLEASCMVGSVLQGITKLISAFAFAKEILGIRIELENLYREYEVKGDDYAEALNKSCERVWQVIKMVFLMHFMIPGIDVDTQVGYLMTLTLHTMCFLFGAFGLFAGDLFFLLFLGQPMLFLDLLVLKVKSLNEAAAENSSNAERLLIEIIEWHQYYTDYNLRCNRIFYYINSMQIVTSGISIICTLYIILLGDWPGAYLYILVAFGGLYLYCIMGTKIQTCNTAFCEELWNINFYDLEVKNQKMIIPILMKAQNPSEIKVGGFLPLSVQTALQITKTIYGIFTMMLRFLEENQ